MTDFEEIKESTRRNLLSPLKPDPARRGIFPMVRYNPLKLPKTLKGKHHWEARLNGVTWENPSRAWTLPQRRRAPSCTPPT